VAPRHGRTVGKAFWPQPMGLFNPAGLPVTEVPLGLNERGLPLGVQVAAGPGRDHVTIRVAQELEKAFGGSVPPRIRYCVYARIRDAIIVTAARSCRRKSLQSDHPSYDSEVPGRCGRDQALRMGWSWRESNPASLRTAEVSPLTSQRLLP
jgi:hypothetical protein